MKGWIHATAHTADLVGFLAADPRFAVRDQAQLLESVSERIRSARVVFSYGEQDRLAVSIASIVGRTNFNSAGFDRWLAALAEADRKLWAEIPPHDDPLKAFENNNYLLQALVARLAAKPPSPSAAHVIAEINQTMAKR